MRDLAIAEYISERSCPAKGIVLQHLNATAIDEIVMVVCHHSAA
jgi:hypothetical protein